MAISNTSTPSADNLMLGAGAVYFDRKDISGNKTGERHLGNCSDFTVNTTVEKVEKYSSMQAAKRLYKSVIKQIKAAGKITLDEYDMENLALALLGTTGTITQASATVTAESFTAYLDRWTKLANRNLSSSGIVVKDAADATVPASNYEVDLLSGRIKILAANTATVVEGEACKIAYTAAAETFPKIVGAAVSKIEGMVRFIGDPTSGPKYEMEAWNCSVQPEAEIGLISDDFKNFVLNLEIMDDSVTHPDDPLYRLIKLT